MSQNLASSSAKSYAKNVQPFLDWLDIEQIDPGRLTGADMLGYIRALKAKGHVQRSIQHKIVALRHYFKFKGYSLQVISQLKIKGIHNPLPEQTLTESELLHIYESYKIESDLDCRDKCMLGLLVFQGITTRELMELNLSEVDLQNQTIEIKAGRTTSGRRLVLRENQITELQTYLTQVRPELFALKSKPTEQLFLTNGISLKKESLKNAIQRISDILKNRLSSYKHTRQLRASVITNWLTHSSLRQVQYMAGHKYISSTERYQFGRILEVEEALSKFHPKR